MRVTRSGNWRMSGTSAAGASTGSAAAPLAVLRESEQASVLLHHPLRLKILVALQKSDSATGVARRMHLPRQTVNYHVRELARVRLLVRAGRRRRRHLYEQCYVATAQSYVVSPDLLGSLAADPARIADTSSADYLLALASKVQAELARRAGLTDGAGQRLATFSIEAELSFTSPPRRTAFAEELQQAIFDVVERHGAAAAQMGGADEGGALFRLMLGCYPISVAPQAAPES